MVANMHPRSRMTTGLFGTTLAVSFLVVGLPHVLPCPVPRAALADTEMTEDGRRQRRRNKRREPTRAEQSQTTGLESMSSSNCDGAAKEAEVVRQKTRECPVPRPSGLIGQVLGFKEREKRDGPLEVRVEQRK